MTRGSCYTWTVVWRHDCVLKILRTVFPKRGKVSEGNMEKQVKLAEN
jgi:hypothetical protein